jgi:hypothetical protein
MPIPLELTFDRFEMWIPLSPWRSWAQAITLLFRLESSRGLISAMGLRFRKIRITDQWYVHARTAFLSTPFKFEDISSSGLMIPSRRVITRKKVFETKTKNLRTVLNFFWRSFPKGWKTANVQSDFTNAIASELRIAMSSSLEDWFCYGIWSCAYHSDSATLIPKRLLVMNVSGPN